MRADEALPADLVPRKQPRREQLLHFLQLLRQAIDFGRSRLFHVVFCPQHSSVENSPGGVARKHLSGEQGDILCPDWFAVRIMPVSTVVMLTAGRRHHSRPRDRIRLEQRDELSRLTVFRHWRADMTRTTRSIPAALVLINKYLVSADGKVVQHFGSNVKPDSAQLTQAIDQLLD